MIFNYLANKCLTLATAKADEITGTGKCYLGLSTTAPKADGTNITEPNPEQYPSYERIQMSIRTALAYTDKWGEINNGVVSNAQEFTSRECLEAGGWPTFSHFIIYDSQTGGNALMGDVLRDPDGTPDETTGLYPEKTLTVAMGKVAVFRAGTLQLQLK